MTDRYEKIRKALAMGPTPGPRRVLEIISVVGSDMGFCSVATTDDTIICDLRDRPLGDAHLIAACDPDTIRALLAERDQLAADLEAAREDAERWRAVREMDGGEIYALLGDCDGIHPEQADAAIDQARGKEVAWPLP